MRKINKILESKIGHLVVMNHNFDGTVEYDVPTKEQIDNVKFDKILLSYLSLDELLNNFGGYLSWY